ncbi:MAG: COG4315 family predicted lipoprotein [Acidimicrobiales bacterium]
MATTSFTTGVASRLSRAKRILVAGMLATSLASVTVLAGSTAGAAVKKRLEVKIVSTSLGKVLFTTSGKALYTYDRDTKDHSNCNGSCISAWPALTVPKGITPTGRGVRGLGVMVRANGARQVTWDGRPLYRFVSDPKGKVTGNGVAGFVAARPGTAWTTTTTTGGYSY